MVGNRPSYLTELNKKYKAKRGKFWVCIMANIEDTIRPNKEESIAGCYKLWLVYSLATASFYFQL